jgi:dihydropyrimidine dehydrogenase (NAD+) subunit PreA
MITHPKDGDTMSDLTVKFGKLDFKNPLMAASGPLAKNQEFMMKCIESGMGAFVTKTSEYVKYLQTYASPRHYVFYPEGVHQGKYYSFYGYEGASEFSPERMVEEIRKVRSAAEKNDCRLIASISGRNLEEWEVQAKLFAPVADMFELMMTYPQNVEEKDYAYMPVRDRIPTGNPKIAADIVKTVRKASKLPLLAKLSIDEGDPTDSIKAMLKEDLDAVNIAHRVHALEIDIETAAPIIAPRVVGYSGPWLGPMSRALVLHVARNCKIQICGHGGLSTWRDCIAHMMAGATTVQMCTEPMLRGYGVFGETITGMESWLTNHGYSSITEIIGKSLPKTLLPINIPNTKKFKATARVLTEKCTGCGFCEPVCFYSAVKLNKNKKAEVNAEKCNGCGLCPQMCPTEAIILEHNGKRVPHTWPGAPGRKSEKDRKTQKIASTSMFDIYKDLGLL